MSRCRWRPIPGRSAPSADRRPRPADEPDGIDDPVPGDRGRTRSERRPAQVDRGTPAYLDQARRAADGLIGTATCCLRTWNASSPTQRVAGIYLRPCQKPLPRNSSLLRDRSEAASLSTSQASSMCLCREEGTISDAEAPPRLIKSFGTEVTTRPRPEELQSTRTCRRAATALSFCLATNGRSCHP